MLKILQFKSKINNNNNKLKTDGVVIGVTRHYPPANKEWFNSIYAFNKNTTKLLPTADNLIISLIRSYFNMFSRFLEKKTKARDNPIWKRRLSSKNFWISKAELKHTNDKVIITLYIFNRQNIKKIKKILSPYLFTFISKTLKAKSSKYIQEIRKENNMFLSKLFMKEKFLKNLEKSYLNDLIKKILKKKKINLIKFMHYMQLIRFNQYKFTTIYIAPLKKILENILGKKIIFNLVILKNYYLNSNILTQILISKAIKKDKNFRILRILKTSLIKIKTLNANKRLILRQPIELSTIQNIFIKDSMMLNKIITRNYSRHNIEQIVLNSIKNKIVNGVRLEASGRLTKRITAARSVFKLKYVGTLKNMDSSYKGLSSVILRGNTKSNIQYTKLNSKTRIGSFGLKGWISSM